MFRKIKLRNHKNVLSNFPRPNLPTFATFNNTPRHMVTILDILSSPVGKYLALLLKQNSLIDELRLYDKNQQVRLIGEDLSHIDTKTRVITYGGSYTLKDAIVGANIVIAVGGFKTKTCQCIKEQFETNITDFRTAAMFMAEYNPAAIFCIAKPPIESLVPLASMEYQKAGNYDQRKIIGVMTPVVMRANYFISNIVKTKPSKIMVPVIGGSTEKTIIPVLSQARPSIQLQQIENLSYVHDSIAYGEDDVLALYNGEHSVSLSPAVGISRFVNILIKALSGQPNCVDCAFVKQSGKMAEFLPYMTSIVRLGKNGVESSHMPKIDNYEAHRLKKAALFIRKNIYLGENYGVVDHSVDDNVKFCKCAENDKHLIIPECKTA